MFGESENLINAMCFGLDARAREREKNIRRKPNKHEQTRACARVCGLNQQEGERVQRDRGEVRKKPGGGRQQQIVGREMVETNKRKRKDGKKEEAGREK